MDRRKYIYLATPLFVLLSCGRLLEELLGTAGALAVAGVAAVIAWGLVWLRLYKQRRLRPEFAVLSILPQSIYFIDKQVNSQLFTDSPAWQNLYALTWLGFVVVGIASIRPITGDTPAPGASRLLRDPVFVLMTPLICLYALVTFTQYYTTLSSI